MPRPTRGSCRRGGSQPFHAPVRDVGAEDPSLSVPATSARRSTRLACMTRVSGWNGQRVFRADRPLGESSHQRLRYGVRGTQPSRQSGRAAHAPVPSGAGPKRRDRGIMRSCGSRAPAAGAEHSPPSRLVDACRAGRAPRAGHRQNCRRRARIIAAAVVRQRTELGNLAANASITFPAMS